MFRILLYTPIIVVVLVLVFVLRFCFPAQWTSTVGEVSSMAQTAVEKSGFSFSQDSTKKSKQKIAINIEQNSVKIREEMELVKDQRQKFRDFLDDQNQRLEIQRQNMQSLRDRIAQGSAFNQGGTKMEQVVNAFDGQHQLFVANGQAIMQMSNEIKTRVDNLGQQLQIAQLLQESSHQVAQDRMVMLADQASALMEQQKSFMERAEEFRRQSQDRTADTKQRLMDASQHLANEHGPDNVFLRNKIEQMLEKQNDMLQKLQANRDRIEQARQQIEQHVILYKERMQSLLDRNATAIADARQRAQDQKRIVQERITDQMQRNRDQAASRADQK